MPSRKAADNFRKRHPDRWKAIQKRSREKHKDRIKAQNEAWRRTASGLVSQLLTGARRRAKEKGLEFSITVADVVVPETCPLLGTPIVRGIGKISPNSPALDRIEISKGYVPGNVWVISQRANAIKNDATVVELFLIANRLWERVNGV